MCIEEGPRERMRQLSRPVFWVFAAVAAFYLLAEHRAHLLGWLPYVIFLACPLMHLLHGGHKHGGSKSSGVESGSSSHHEPERAAHVGSNTHE